MASLGSSWQADREELAQKRGQECRVVDHDNADETRTSDTLLVPAPGLAQQVQLLGQAEAEQSVDVQVQGFVIVRPPAASES
jgi:hypothetical protein